MKKLAKRIATRVKKDSENGARVAVIEDLFNDFYRKRLNVYWVNFVRGIFFGVGSVIGATVVVGLIVWLLSLFSDVPGGIGNFIQSIVDAMNRRD